MTDFSVPQRMTLSAFFIYLFKYFKLFFSAFVIYLIYNIFNLENGFIESMLKIAAMAGGVAVLAIIFASMAYFQIKFHVEGGNLIYRHGVLRRARTTIPLNRIHALRTRQSLLYRVLGLRGIVFDTLASKGEELELILSESDWECLLNRIEWQEKPQPAAGDMPSVSNPSTVRKFSNGDLVLDALCQNHLKGMLVLGAFVAAVFNNLISDLPDGAIEKIVAYLESNFNHFAVSVSGMVMIMALAYILSLLLWLGKVLLRYYDLSLTYDSKMLAFSHGLLSRLSSRFACDKICTLRVKRNYLEKRFGLCTLYLKQALNSSAEKEEDNLKIYGRDCSGFFLRWWLGHDYSSESDVATAKSGLGVVSRSLIPDWLLSFAVMGVLWHFGLYVWMVLPAIYMLAAIPKSILSMRHSYITLKESYIIIGNGRFAEIRNFLKYDNVEVERITRTPLSRFTDRVSLSLSTTGTTFTVRSIRRDMALNIYELLLQK